MTLHSQTLLFPDLETKNEYLRPVNVSSVPQRSPFRYPGGKTWFVPTFRQWIDYLNPKPKLLIEPFAGGGIISLTAAFENLAPKILMVELDDEIAAVWETVVNGGCDWLANKILKFDLTEETVKKELKRKLHSQREKAFQTILKNRTYHGGILANGSGLLKYGENGKGIKSRWYPMTLAKRFFNMDQVVIKIKFQREDGLKVIQEHINDSKAIFFIDPPYTAGGKKAGKRLYNFCELDHERLFELCSSMKGEFLMTYDNADEVKAMARQYGFQMRLVPMKNTHHATMEELVVGKDLTWMDRFTGAHEPQAPYLIKNRSKIRHSKTKKIS